MSTTIGQPARSVAAAATVHANGQTPADQTETTMMLTDIGRARASKQYYADTLVSRHLTVVHDKRDFVKVKLTLR